MRRLLLLLLLLLQLEQELHELLLLAKRRRRRPSWRRRHRCGCDWQLRLRRRQQLLLSMQRRRGLGCHCCLPLRVLRQRAELCQQRAPVHLLLLRHAKTHQALALLLLLLLVLLRLGPRLGLGLGARLEQRLERAARRAHHRRRRAGVQRGGGPAHHASGQDGAKAACRLGARRFAGDCSRRRPREGRRWRPGGSAGRTAGGTAGRCRRRNDVLLAAAPLGLRALPPSGVVTAHGAAHATARTAALGAQPCTQMREARRLKAASTVVQVVRHAAAGALDAEGEVVGRFRRGGRGQRLDGDDRRGQAR